MKSRVIIFVLLFAPTVIYCQQSTTSTIATSVILNDLSSLWKKDSLANNGFRLLNRKKLLDSKVDVVTKDILRSKLGKPNRVWNTNKGTLFVYYVRDSQAIDKNDSLEIVYISFLFNGKTNLLESISEDAMP